MIREHVAKDGTSTFGVRVGKARHWIGTYSDRHTAVEAERLAKAKVAPAPRIRRCASCMALFGPRLKRQVRCPTCLERTKKPRDDHWLYRCFDAEDSLLYVGITSAGLQRFKGHGDFAEWWPQVATIRVEHFDSREQVEEAEREAIKADKPLHNVRGTPNPKATP